jgi:hypothetical protein
MLVRQELTTRAGSFWPLTLRDGKADSHGFIVHQHAIRMFTAALPMMFDARFREYYQRETLEVAKYQANGDSIMKKPTEDLLLERTQAFMFVDQNGRPGVPTRLLMSGQTDGLKIVSLTRITQEVWDANEAAARYDRPVVTLLPGCQVTGQVKAVEQVMKTSGFQVTDDVPPAMQDCFTIIIQADTLGPACYGDVVGLIRHVKGKKVCVLPYAFGVAVVVDLR